MKKDNILPIIGISANYADETYRIAQQYADCIMQSGACAIILPITDNPILLEKYMDSIDGLLLTGGGDMDPKFWGEDALPNSDLSPLFRDEYDLQLYITARRKCMPIMGICRGMQVIAIAEGGSLYQDIHQCYDSKAMNHSPKCDKKRTAHSIKTMHKLFENIKEVNSIHHQSINHLPEIFSLGAIAEDGVIEAFISENYPIFGVQWHPEHLAAEHPEHAALFEHFKQLAITYKQAKEIHKTSHIIDSHTDSPMVWKENTDMNEWQEEMMVDFKKMCSAQMAATFMVAYLPQALKPEEAYREAVNILKKLKIQALNSNLVDIAESPNDVETNHSMGIPSVVLAIENAHALNGDIKNVEMFHNMGVHYITLCHNGDNDICDSCSGANLNNGVSKLGRTIIKEMNRLNIMIDISHASDNSMEQIIELSSMPVIASHSGAREICNHRRNIPDNILKLLAKKGGVCQICLYDAFLNEESSNASIKDVIKHIKHIVKIVGIDHVGIGSDFDGGTNLKGCMGENEFINITMLLIKEGFSYDDIIKIMGGNLMRVWRINHNLKS